MLMKAVKIIGQPVCAALYAVFAYWATKKKYVPLIILFLTHLLEYFLIGRKTGKENRISLVKALLLCLSFGFTWWLPLRMNKTEINQ